MLKSRITHAAFFIYAMNTIVYVDGFNFYHGRVKGTDFKWLDLWKLFNDHLLPASNQDFNLLSIKYFTAEIKANFASKGAAAHSAQQSYHRALEHIYGDRIEIIKGFYSSRIDSVMAHVEGQNPSKHNRCKVWKLEEKQTDVRMALHAYHDALTGNCDQVVICSNDSDMVPPIEMIKTHSSQTRVGVIIPRKQNSARVISSISEMADWKLEYVSDAAMEASLLPDSISTGKKPIRRPAHWFPEIDQE